MTLISTDILKNLIDSISEYQWLEKTSTPPHWNKSLLQASLPQKTIPTSAKIPMKPKTTTDKELISVGTSYAYSLTHNIQDAEDLAQQAWLKLTKRYGKAENRAILFTAIRNLHYDQLRRSRIVQYFPLDTAPEAGKCESYGTDHDMEVALAQLSPNERSTIYLNVVEGYSAREISGRLGLPRGTVLSHLYRGRKKLKELLSEEFGVRQTEVA